MQSRLSRPLVVLSCIAGGVLAGLVVFLLSTGGGSTQPEEHDGGLLLTGDRNELQICIEHADTSTSEVMQGLRESLDALSGHANWSAAGLDKGVPAIASGCNSSPFLLSDEVRFENGGFTVFSGFPEVEDPSPFRVMIFVLPDEQVDEMFGDSPLRSVGQEALCANGQCATVTAGLYLKESELKDGAYLEDALAVAVGLERPTEIPTAGEEDLGE